MTSRFFRFAVLFVLLLLTAQVVQPYIFRLMYAATTPKIVVPRGTLSEAEQSTIALGRANEGYSRRGKSGCAWEAVKA